MANRKLPFGYCMRNGQVCVSDEEAAAVRRIFEEYANGSSYLALAEAMNRQGIPYGTGKPWNKNAVARLLQNLGYTGAGGLPAIVPEELFQKIVPAFSGRAEHPELKHIRMLARCPFCGGAVRRERMDQWRCPACMTAPLPLTDGSLIRQVTGLLQMLQAEPDIITAPEELPDNEAVQEAQAGFARQLEQPDFDEQAAKTAALSLASARLNALSSADYETTRIRYLLERAEDGTGLDTGLLREIAAAVLLYPDGRVGMQLKNHQVIER